MSGLSARSRSIADELDDPRRSPRTRLVVLVREAQLQRVGTGFQIRREHHRSRIMESTAEGVEQVRLHQRSVIDRKLHETSVRTREQVRSDRSSLKGERQLRAGLGRTQQGNLTEAFPPLPRNLLPLRRLQFPPLAERGLFRVDESAGP